MQYLGVNLASAEFGSLGQSYGTGYTYPTHDEIDYYAAKGLNVIRVPFLWERMQTALNGGLDRAELQRLDDVVNYASSKGLSIDLDLHNYGTYNGQLVGSSAVPNAAFADFWGKLAAHYASNDKVMFGLMNEPQQSSARDWLASENAAIAAIRSAGAGQEVLVSGVGWDGAWTWTGSGTQNAAVIGAGVVDSAHNYAFEVHQYLDYDGSGSHSSVVSPNVGVTRLAAITQWAEQTGSKLFLGEFGVASDSASLSAMSNMLAYMNQHAGAWQGATYWAGGPWWGDYMFSIEPENGVDAAQMSVLQQAEQQGLLPAVSITRQALATDTGASATDNITSNGAVTLSGTVTGPAGTLVRIADGSTLLGAAKLGTGGTWTYTTTLAAGSHALVAIAVDPAGNAGASAAAATISVLTAAPAVAITGQRLSQDTGASASDNVTSNGAVTLSGTVAGAPGTLVQIVDVTSVLGSATLGTGGTWSYTTTLAAGSHALAAVATDLAGNSARTAAGAGITVVTAGPTIAITSETASASTGRQTIAGTVSGAAGTTVALYNGTVPLGAATLDGRGGWSLTTSLAPGSYAIAAVATDLAGNTASVAPPFVVPPGVQTATTTTSLETLVLSVSEDAYKGDAQFTVSVDGSQIGGVQSVTALRSLGQSQELTFTGVFGSGTHRVGINFLNDAYDGRADLDRNLYVNAITLDGTRTSENAAQLGQGLVTYALPATKAPAVVPSSPSSPTTDTLVVSLSEDAYLGDAQFVVTFDGTRVGDTQTVTALRSLGQSQDFTFQGSFGTGPHTVGIDFLNDAYAGSAETDRNLYVNAIALGGAKVAQNVAQMGAGVVRYAMPSAATPASDTLVLSLSEDAYLGDAQFTVTVDGTQVGGTQTVTALRGLGQSQDLTFTGMFGTGSHMVGINFLNDAYAGTSDTDRNLYVNTVTLDGTKTILNAAQMAQGPATYAVATPATSTDTLVLSLSEDAYLGDAQFTVTVDGTQVGGTQSVSALHGLGQSQDFTFTGPFGTGSHTVGVNFLNDAYAGSAETDRNLYVNAISLDGNKTVANAAQMAQGLASYHVRTPTVAALAATPTASIGVGATLILDKDAGAGAAVSFAGANGVAQFTCAEAFHGSIAGFGRGDTLDLRSIGFDAGRTTLAYADNGASGTLTVSDGSHAAKLAMVGSYTAARFTLASDQQGGTAVKFSA